MTASTANANKLGTGSMLEYGALCTRYWSEMAKQHIQMSSDLIKAHSDQLGALAQIKSPEEFCNQQIKYVTAQIPKTFEHTERVLGIMQDTVKETGKFVQKQAEQYTQKSSSQK